MKHRFHILFILGLFLAASAAGQGQVRDFRYAKEANPLLGFGNAALLATFGDGGFSEATGSFVKENGDVIPLEGSPDSWKASAGTRSFRRVSDRLVFSGELDYSYFRGNGMGAQILIEPSDNAINFLEEDFSTSGVKKRETYFLHGGLSWSFNDRLSAGLAIDYKAEDQVKYKDPRFLNVLMDMTVAPGFAIRGEGGFLFGGNLIYRHKVEQLSAGNYGTVDRQYFILVDQGSFYGQKELFEGDVAYVSTQNMRPLTDNRYGLSLQAATGGRNRFSAQLTGLWRDGYFGNRTSSTVVFCEFGGPEAFFEGVLTVPSGKDLQIFTFDAGAKFLSNYTNSYSYKAVAGMSTTVEYTGQSQTFSRTECDATLSWKLRKNDTGYCPDWVFAAVAKGVMRNQYTIIYPEYRKQNYLRASLDLSAERNIKRASDCISFGADLFGCAGFGTANEDGSHASATSTLKSFDDWLYRQFEFDTAARAGAEVSVAWTLLRYAKVAPYIKLSDRFVTLLSAPQYLSGQSRNTALVTLGCNF